MISTTCALDVLNISQKISGGSSDDKDAFVSSNHITKPEDISISSNLCDHLSSAICVHKSLYVETRSTALNLQII